MGGGVGRRIRRSERGICRRGGGDAQGLVGTSVTDRIPIRIPILRAGEAILGGVIHRRRGAEGIVPRVHSRTARIEGEVGGTVGERAQQGVGVHEGVEGKPTGVFRFEIVSAIRDRAEAIFIQHTVRHNGIRHRHRAGVHTGIVQRAHVVANKRAVQDRHLASRLVMHPAPRPIL